MCGIVFATGCHHERVAPPNAGAGSFAFLEEPSFATPPEETSGKPNASGTKHFEDFRDADPINPLATPVYPARALAAKAGQAVVSVRITVDERGQVSDIAPSIVGFSTPGPFADDFYAAVEKALRHWRFTPAEIDQVESAWTPREISNRVVRTDKTETHFDVTFTFTASGGVISGAQKK